MRLSNYFKGQDENSKIEVYGLQEWIYTTKVATFEEKLTTF